MLAVSILHLFLGSVLAIQSTFNPTLKAPLVMAAKNDGIANKYIITLNKKFISDKESLDKHLGFVESLTKIANLQQSKDIYQVDHIYDSVFYGYSVTLDDATLDLLRYSEEIEYIEQDKKVTLHEIQNGATWGLERISQTDPATAPYTYKYGQNPGLGVNVYVVDTGININHVEFEGRATYGTVTPSGDNNGDCSGHGTHVAGIIAGKTYGVAKKARVISVKVVKCDGTGVVSDFIAGINWLINDHVKRTNSDIIAGRKRTKSVGNISIGSTYSESLNRSVDVANYKGIFFINSAGNENDNACHYSPSGSALSIVVSSSELNDTRSSYSNYGYCSNLFAPGANIQSAYIGSNTATAVKSGTSVAAPFVTGIAAIIQSKSGFYPYSYADMKPMILLNSTMGSISSAKGTTNYMAYSIPHM